LQEKYREAMVQMHQLQTARDHLETTCRMLEEESRTVKLQYEEQAALFRKERQDLQLRVQELLKDSEKGKSERERQLVKYREKSSSYKTKLRLALQNVQTLAQRIAKYELQLGPERENGLSDNRLGGTPVVISNGIISASGGNMRGIMGSNVGGGGTSMDDIERMVRRL
jgi:chromosome segregation ATPase